MFTFPRNQRSHWTGAGRSLGHVNSEESPEVFLGYTNEQKMRVRREVLRHVVHLLAGAEAQRLLCPDVAHVGDSSDRRRAVEALAAVCRGVELRRRFRHLRRVARRYVQHPRIRADVSRLAQALLRYRTIDGQAADVVVSCMGRLTWAQIVRHLPDGPLEPLLLGAISRAYEKAGLL